MRDVPQRWQSWRIRLVRLPTTAELPSAVRLRATLIDPKTHSPETPGPTDFRREIPDAQGIRRGLVVHVRQLIAAGHYDTPERWALAEELLIRRMDEAR